jgi:hypothetical protein
MASGGEVHMDDSPNSGMITTKGFGASQEKHNELPVGQKRTHL